MFLVLYCSKSTVCPIHSRAFELRMLHLFILRFLNGKTQQHYIQDMSVAGSLSLAFIKFNHITSSCMFILNEPWYKTDTY
jgi:hypothetical protein